MLPSEIPPTPLAKWKPSNGDVFIADTQQNVGYLVSREGAFTVFPIATGQKRVVRYIGRTYDATTPLSTWTVKEKEIKGDRITFGDRGIFFRLFDQSRRTELRTPYGIHSHRSITKMLALDDRYKSMGCILVSDDVIDMVTLILKASDDGMTVITTLGFDDLPISGEHLKEWIGEQLSRGREIAKE
jgi:hypothetical protein